MIVVLFLDTIIKRNELQKSEKSMRYVKGRIENICTGLISAFQPPSDWQKLLNDNNFDLENYFNQVLTFKERAQVEFDEILDKYMPLIESDLRNDVFDIINLLNTPTWSALQEPTIYLEDKLWRIRNYVNLILGLINSSIEVIKTHDLLEASSSSLIIRNGELPKLEYHSKSPEIKRFFYSQFDGILNQARTLKETCDEKSREQIKKINQSKLSSNGNKKYQKKANEKKER